jgi:hypothetical protein
MVPPGKEGAMSLFEVMTSIFWFMLLVAWFWLMITVISDVFRDRALSGWAKALWCIFVIVLPWLGVLVYLIARGRSMNERAVQQAQDNEQAFRHYVREAATGGPSVADELAKLADLRDRGVLSPADYESAKNQVLRQATPVAVTNKQPQSPSGSVA